MDIKEIKQKIEANLSSVIVIVAGAILIIGGIIFSLSHHRNSEEPVPGCNTTKKILTVEAGMTDVLPAGTQIEVEEGFYNCHQGNHDDIVMIKTPGRDTPLIEYIKMIPGDTFDVRPRDKSFDVYVNGSAMENSKGDKYTFNDRTVAMIKLYESNFKAGIRKDVYFVFADDVLGGFDSTRFGPVMPERMIGKVRVLASDSKQAEEKKEEAKPDETKELADTNAEKTEKVEKKKEAAPAATKATPKPAAAKKPHAKKQ